MKIIVYTIDYMTHIYSKIYNSQQHIDSMLKKVELCKNNYKKY